MGAGSSSGMGSSALGFLLLLAIQSIYLSIHCARNASSSSVTIADCFHHAEPYIQQAESGDRSAHKAQLNQVLEPSPLCRPAIAEPKARPWKNNQHQPKFDAE